MYLTQYTMVMKARITAPARLPTTAPTMTGVLWPEDCELELAAVADGEATEAAEDEAVGRRPPGRSEVGAVSILLEAGKVVLDGPFMNELIMVAIVLVADLVAKADVELKPFDDVAID